MKKIAFFTLLFLLICVSLFSQVAISADGSSPDESAALGFTNKGFLPRPGDITALISGWPDGLLTTDKKFTF
jgi:hypothetical protein